MRYRVYSDYLRQRYGEKVYKLPVSLPVTCPNRDGTCGVSGCIFCGEIGAGYENLPAEMTVGDQLAANIAHIAPKYKARKFIAYFQNFSNTYLPPDKLADYLAQAIVPGVVGMAVATRPDCLGDRHLEVMAAVRDAHKVDIFLELGLQTVNYHSLLKVNRGHTLAEFIDAVLRARRYGIETCAHVILNLPWDDMTDTVENAKVLSALGVEQVKLHALYIVKGTVLAERYARGEVTLISREEYIERVVTFLEYLHPDIVLQRLVGRAPASHTLFANWQSGWWTIRDDIERLLVERDTRQGRLCRYLGGAAAGKFL
jgi:radical SAM protein (TIGR01212 family)